MRTIKYKTLKGFFKNCGIRQLTFPQFIRKELYNSNKGGWFRFELSESAEEQCIKMFASALCSTKPSQERYAKYIKDFWGSTPGILNRLWIESRNGKFESTYCAGQDYEAEITLVRKLIKG